MLLPRLFGGFAAVRRTAGRRSAKRQAAKAARFRPRVELLESRFAPALLVGPNVNITRFVGGENEAAIAMDPTNTLHLFEVSNENLFAAAGLLAAFSTDGGITWTREFLATGTGTVPAACCDAQAVFDEFGNLFVSYLDAGFAADDLLLSIDGGQSFRLVQSFPAADQPKVAVGDGSVWVSFSDGVGISVAGAHVTGLGAVGPFTPLVELDGSTNGVLGGGNFGEMAIGPSGQVFVEYVESVGTTVINPDNPGAPDVILGNLGGFGAGLTASFGPGHVIAYTNVGGFDGMIGAAGNVGTGVEATPTGIDAEPKVVFDRTGGTFNNRLYLVYNDAPSIFSGETSVYEQHSDDNGVTWSARVKINDNTVFDETFYPSLSIDESATAGAAPLVVQFYDTRMDQGQGGPNDPSNIAADDAQLWASSSFDGGATWSKNVQISAGTSDPVRGNVGTPPGLRLIGYGDYMHSTAFFAGVWYPVWADNSNSTGDNPNGTLNQFNIYTAKVLVFPGTGAPPGIIPIIPPGTTGTTGTTGLIGMVPNPPPAVDPPGSRTSNGANAFTTVMGATWPAGGNWTVVKGDFNGDGMTDIAGFNQQTGQWWVSLSNGTSYTTSVWANWSPMVHWSNIKAGDFTGDGKTDIIGYENGAWWVAVSTGSSFTTTLWGVWSPAVNWSNVQVADFTGSGMADITARDPQSGAWWTGVSTGSSFSTSLWAVWSPAVTWVDVNVGDFTGSGRAGITGRVLQSGQWWTGVSTGSSFATSLWATWNPSVTWVDVNVGDFNGDGKMDIIGRVLQSGQWWVGQSTGSGFASSLWATWSPFVNWVNVQVGDFNGDGMADITGMIQGTGQWWTGVSTGSSFSTSLWATWAAGVDWVNVQVGNFNGEGITAMAGQSGQWWTAFPVISSGTTSSSTTNIATAPIMPPPPGPSTSGSISSVPLP